MSGQAGHRIVAGLALAVALAACARPPSGSISVVFDRPMVPEDAGRTFLHCGIHHTPWQAALAVWQVSPDISRKQLDCLRRQPHVESILPAE